MCLNNNNIVKLLYSAYILNKVKLRGATNKIMWLIIHGDRQRLSMEHGTAENLWWNSNFKQICFQFYTKGVRPHNEEITSDLCLRLYIKKFYDRGGCDGTAMLRCSWLNLGQIVSIYVHLVPFNQL